MIRPGRAGSLVVRAALSLALGACAVVPVPRGLYVGSAVPLAPPPPRAEVYGAVPTPGYFWMGGYWNWIGGRYVWVAGHWAASRRGYHWVPRHWVHTRDGWHLRGGRWMRRH
ncbi:MAG: hypothetical protein ACRET2_05190 [Steroidobacteraceae bacterium]